MRAVASPETQPDLPADQPIDQPPARDVTVDLLRAVAIVAVAVGHWLVVVPAFSGGRFDGVNALETVPAMRGLSWLFQVMPLFFVLGGYANAHSWRSAQRRGVAYHGWLRTRLERLLRPSVAFVGVWVLASVALRGVGIDPELVRLLAWLAVVPVWFLAVYVVVVAAAPLLLHLHQRFGVTTLIVLGALATFVDAIRLGTDINGVEWTNFFWVFLFAQQLGFFWADGRLARRPWVPIALAAGGLVSLVALTVAGPYPISLVGVPGEEIANNAPPTITLVALGIAQTGIALLLRPAIERWVERPRVLRSVVGLNVHAMTMLLWHFTALILAAAIILPLGIVPTYPDGTFAWWAVRVLAVLAMCGPLALLVALFGRVERQGAASTPGGPSVGAGRIALDLGGRVSPAGAVRWPRVLHRDRVLIAAMLLATVLSAAAFGLIAVGGLSTGAGWWGVPVVPVVLLATSVALTRMGDPEAMVTA